MTHCNNMYDFWLLPIVIFTFLRIVCGQQQGPVNQNVNPGQEAGQLFSGIGTNPVYGGELFLYRFVSE